MYLERRRRLWYALHPIPEDVRPVIGRARFVRSLETEDRKVAERRAAVLEARWRSDIERARTKSGDHVEHDAEFWRRVLADAPEPERDAIRNVIGDEARAKVERSAARAGIFDDRDPRYAELPELADAQRFVAIATGALVRLDEHLDEYLASLANEKKTVDMKRSTVRKFCEGFRYTADVERKAVQRWVNQQVQDGKKAATVRRDLGDLRGYWTYLQSIEVVSESVLPFDRLTLPKLHGKNSTKSARKHFEPADVVNLWRAATEHDDQQLADLITLGMWTGARIEELCSMKVTKVNTSKGCLEIEDAKTEAGWRQVPIHSKLKPTVARLVKESKDGFLLSGLTENKYHKRKGAIGKRFATLKTAMSFGPDHVFHSIRKTVATLLENAQVPENVAADILGHDKPTMTYGLYSGGASLETKREAIEKLAYTLP